MQYFLYKLMTWKMPNEICLTKVLIKKKKKNHKQNPDDVLNLYSNSLYNMVQFGEKKEAAWYIKTFKRCKYLQLVETSYCYDTLRTLFDSLLIYSTKEGEGKG